MAGSKQDFLTALNRNTAAGAPFAESNVNSLASSENVALSVNGSFRFGLDARGARPEGES